METTIVYWGYILFEGPSCPHVQVGMLSIYFGAQTGLGLYMKLGVHDLCLSFSGEVDCFLSQEMFDRVRSLKLEILT